MWTIDRGDKFLRWQEHNSRFSWEKFAGGRSHALCFQSQEPENLLSWIVGLSQYFLCENKNLCGLCNGCLGFFRKDPLRFVPVFPAGISISVDSIRQILSLSSVSLGTGQKQVFLIFYPSQMAKEAANALLKTLEEPPPNRVFLLFNPMSRLLLPTIASRVSRVTLPSSRSFEDGGDSGLLARLSLWNWNLKADEFPLAHLSSAFGLSRFYEDFAGWLKGFPQPDQILGRQLLDFNFSLSRRIAVLNFLESLSCGDFGFLEEECVKMKEISEEITSAIIHLGTHLQFKSKEERTSGLQHWLLGDFGKENAQKFARGVLFREWERVFCDLLRCVESLFLEEEKSRILPQEMQIKLNCASLSPLQLSELDSVLARSLQMLYNSVPFDNVLEFAGLQIMKLCVKGS